MRDESTKGWYLSTLLARHGIEPHEVQSVVPVIGPVPGDAQEQSRGRP
jgi:hypothetical protein